MADSSSFFRLIFDREKTHEGIKEVVKPFDWSYTTDYKGTLEGKQFVTEEEPLPLALLRRPDPILFFEEVVLYESELDDNGISILSIKVRVMPERMLLLCRMFMRLDKVLFRIRDTRVYVDFKAAKVTREYTATQEKFDTVMQVCSLLHAGFDLVANFTEGLMRMGKLPDEVTVAMRDPNQISSLLSKVDYSLESVTLP
jgi:type 2A phosphatase activator TIP41